MRQNLARRATDLALVFAGIAASIATGRVFQLNPTTVALVLVTVVVALSAWRGSGPGIVASLVAAASLNYFFLPPRHTWVIDDPGNWIALACLLIASLVASRLMARVGREAENAREREEEVEALYRLSVDLVRATSRPGSLSGGIERALEAARAEEGGLVMLEGSPYRQRRDAWRGPWRDEMEDLVASAARHRHSVEFGLPGSAVRDVYLPLLVGGHAIGVFVARATVTPAVVLESVATLVALTVERERLVHEHAHVEALRESDAAKTTLLRAASHDLSTPLTAIAIQAGRLTRLGGPEVRAIAESLSEESDRLRRRIENLLAMARLQAGSFVASPEPTPPADLFRAARESLAALLRSRRVHVTVSDDCPDVWIDPALAVEILVNLIENAHRAAPADTAIDLLARPESGGATRVILEVADRGRGIDVHAISKDGARRGLGLEIVQGLARAIEVDVTFEPREGGGSVARLTAAAASLDAAIEVAE